MNKVLRILFIIYLIIIFVPVFSVVTVVCSTVCIIGCILGFYSWAAYYPGVIWSRIALWLTFCPITVYGRENISKDGLPYVVVANHQSMYDIFAMYGYMGIPFRWVMKQSLRNMMFIGKACEIAGFIFVDETKRTSIANTIEQGKKTLKGGNSIFIFPEGSRTMTGKMGKFKKGAFLMASELGRPILPVSINGAFDVLVRGEKVPHPHRIILTIHKPFYMSELGEHPLNIIESSRKSHEIIASVLPREKE